ncbi:MAG: terminase large subunit domain-containing protein, partial [Phycisphaerae bacterium]
MTTIHLPALHNGREQVDGLGGQLRALRAYRDARFLVLYCGRRWGKSMFEAWVAYHTAGNGGQVWWIAPTFPVGSTAWEELLRPMAAYIPGSEVSLSDRRVTFPGGGAVQVKSADNPDSLRGKGLDLAILDEAAFMRERVWMEAVRPTLTERRGKAIFGTTPNGINWMYNMYNTGQVPNDQGIVSLRFPTADNPYIPLSEIEAARGSPAFAQEYEANPAAGNDGVIPLHWVQAACDRWREWQADGAKREGELVLGVDVAGGGGDVAAFAHRYGWVIAELSDHTPRRRDEYGELEDAAVALLQAGGYAIVDAVGVGAPIPSHLRGRGVKAAPYKGSAGTKLRDSTGMFGFDNVRSAAWW